MFFYKIGVYMKVCNEQLLESMLSYIKTYQVKNGRSPSYRNIMKALNLSSLSVVFRYIDVLRSRGELEKNDLGEIGISSNLNCCKSVIAPILGTVTCGAPIYAQENIEGVYSLPSAIFGRGELFLLHAEGDSMINAGIQNGDILVVRKTEVAENGQIVVALLGDSATVKTFYKKKDCVVLHPENPQYKDIITKEVKILGIVEHLIHKF